jgi:hypothetical protein
MGKQYNDYYTYAYLREDKTPYYIGKGRGERIYSTSRSIKAPKDTSRIIYLKKNLTEAEAFKHEVYMISVLGRKDLGTGILRNLTNGGEGTSGHIKSEECKKKIGEARIGKTHTEEWKKAISEKLSGRTHTEEAKKKMSVAKSGEKHPLFGVPGKTGALHPRSKAIIVIELDGTQRHYGGIREAARDLIIDRSSLCRYLKTGHVLTQGPRKGWQFLFKNSEDF